MRVLFVCSGGMSSAIVVQALKKEAQKQGLDLEVMAVGTSEVETELKKGWDLVLVAPQVKHRLESIQKIADRFSVPCDSIPPQAYTPLGGALLLKTVNERMKDK
ncbi:PTS sugar transporter subunit IIB [Melghirimyces algeriensis]|uniref:PTS system, cellobiose-specific IIB component n=1 Tax=Melghirimyces algeriensis TaxID=910412 RepID=A0A521ERV4_9BACL|nr:PTS sugar transporter subunit IIB [Melghirimyces algeriensis]SMO86645.1 PTS system, cellobiose-specific IIB component [Melghirimyces algeriensis]